MIKYVPDGDLHDTNYVNAYNSAMVLEAVLKACGNDLSTENILKQAYSIKDLELPMLLPGIKVNTVADRPRAGRPDAVHALQRQDLGAVWRIADGELTRASFRGDAVHESFRESDPGERLAFAGTTDPGMIASQPLCQTLRFLQCRPAYCWRARVRNRRAPRTSHGRRTPPRSTPPASTRNSAALLNAASCCSLINAAYFPIGVFLALVDLRSERPGHPDRFRQRLGRRQAGARWPSGAGL